MILVLGGTSDSIHICDKLNDMGLPYIVSVTTEYGRDIAKKATENVFLGKLTKEYFSISYTDAYCSIWNRNRDWC